MEKQIPLYFDSIVVDSPVEKFSENIPNLSRLKVRVFTKYGNCNGSYITEAVANQLIDSATSGIVPVIGFFDPETKSWASHSGPKLSKAYGYVDSFIGWEPFTDTDGITRDYAVFSVIIFTDYFEEANNIKNQNESMEIKPDSITGDWTTIEGTEYFVYETAKMNGFCIIGSHEPCFSRASFNSDLDEQLSSLLFSLKTQVEELEKINKGGENTMENEKVENIQEVAEEENKEEVVENFEAAAANENETTVEQFNEETTTEQTVENVAEETEEVKDEVVEEQETVNFEQLYNDLQSKYEKDVTELTETNKQLNDTVTELQTKINNYEAQMNQVIEEKKNSLIEKYEKVLDAEEINNIRDKMNDFTYDELESKLAISFANSKINNIENDTTEKVFIPEQPESQFALLMKKYRKN